MTPKGSRASAVFCTLLLLLHQAVGVLFAVERPNVILIMTDDQGYGDIAAHGNPIIETPNLDRLYADSVRLTNYHVDPTCSPTRAALMTGRYSTRTGVWHTVMGRSLMDARELTLAEIFRANGYRTAMFGKWHLGDNYPLRPEDQGFDYVVRHGGGGIGQTPDWWGNDYFDDHYWKNGRVIRMKGYCTDVWFREAMQFIRDNKDRPFFVYLATNAPHAPYRVPTAYADRYRRKGLSEPLSAFYGMITNIDENLGRLRALLDELELTERTILIFTTDNGTAAGWQPRRTGPMRGFNAGMRGKKGSVYEGGHRVPFFIYWPGGRLDGGRDVDQLTAHIDILPTLVDLCGLQKPKGPPLDGVSLREALNGNPRVLRDRILFVHSQRIQFPEKARNYVVMTDRWRLVNGRELYDVRRDPGQQHDVAAEHPHVVTGLQAAYERWWRSLTPVFRKYVRIHIGSPHENPTRLTAHDWHSRTIKDCPWNQRHVERDTGGNGFWTLYVRQAGKYRIELYRWPRVLSRPADRIHARIRIAGQEKAKQIDRSDVAAVFEVTLDAGPCELMTWLTRPDGSEHGAYFVWIRRVED